MANVVGQLFKLFPNLVKVSQSMICAVNLKYCSLGSCFCLSFLISSIGLTNDTTTESSDVVPSDAEIALIPPIRSLVLSFFLSVVVVVVEWRVC